MSSYIDGSLLANEQVIFRTELHWVVYLPGIIFVCLGGLMALINPFILAFLAEALPVTPEKPLAGLAFAIVLVGVLMLLSAYVQQHTTELGVTNKRVLAKFGWISRTTFELFLGKVEGANIEQTIWGRLLGYGSIHVKGTGGGISPIDNIREPRKFQKILLEQISRNQDAQHGQND